MKLTVFTPTCDRPEAFAFCEKWMAAQTRKPDQWIVVDDSEKPLKLTMGQQFYHRPEFRGKGSMVKKLRMILESGTVTGDVLVFIEDDDLYSKDYLAWIEKSIGTNHLIGEGRNLYYNVRNRWWFDHGNMQHASLCATAVARPAFPLLLQEAQNTEDPFIDSRLWRNCRGKKQVFDPQALGRRLTVGIKAMPGLRGYGSGHDTDSGWAIRDPELKKLRELIGDRAEEYAKFYDTTTPAVVGPSVEVHIVAFNEELILPYTLRHYKTFASRIVIHDGGSTDRTKEIAKAAGAEVHDWDTAGKINDELLRILKETCWVGTKCDFAIVVDADEFVHMPEGASHTLSAYFKAKVPVIKCKGFEMESPELPKTDGQIYDEINHGAPDDRWYGKPCILQPRLLKSIHFTHGAHEANAELLSGARFIPRSATLPEAKLLHYHHIGSVERIGARYDGNKSRFSEENKKHGWGWSGDGLVHAKQKRAKILAQRMKVL